MMKPVTFVLLFLVGALVMFAFDYTLTLIVGMALQVAAVVLGLFVVLTPGFLEGDAEN